MTTIYIYNVTNGEIVDQYEGATNADCERLAAAANWDQDEYGWTYLSPSPTEGPMKTITVNLYNYDELTEEAQERAREWWRSIDDGEALRFSMECLSDNDGVSFSEWSTYPYYVRIDWRRTDWRELAQTIMRNHGRQCDTYKATRSFLHDLHEARREWTAEYYDDTYYNDVHTYKVDYYQEECPECYHIIEEYKNDMENEYASILRAEDEYLSSDEYIAETLIVNEYEFTKEGERY